MKNAIGLACIVLLTLAGGCTKTDQGRTREQRLGTVQSFRPVSYRRTGGFAGADDRVTITQDGTIEVRTRTGSARGQLNEFQIMQVARAFDGWDALQPNYPAPRPAADTFTTTIQYGDKTVTASETAENLPPVFTSAAERIRTLAAALPRQ